MGHHSCCNKMKVKRGLWSPEEDERLINYITTYGHGCWSSVPRQAGLQRCGKSCRLRWINYLRPDLKRGSFTIHEAALIIELHRFLGNRWSQIAKHLPGRTDNEVKNFWNSSIKKKILAQHDLLLSSNPQHPPPPPPPTQSHYLPNPTNNPIFTTSINNNSDHISFPVDIINPNPIPHSVQNNNTHILIQNNNLIIPNAPVNPMLYVPNPSPVGVLPVQNVQGFVHPLMTYGNPNLAPIPPASIYIPPVNVPPVPNVPSFPDFSYPAGLNNMNDNHQMNVQNPVGNDGNGNGNDLIFVSDHESHPMSPLLNNDFFTELAPDDPLESFSGQGSPEPVFGEAFGNVAVQTPPFSPINQAFPDQDLSFAPIDDVPHIPDTFMDETVEGIEFGLPDEGQEQAVPPVPTSVPQQEQLPAPAPVYVPTVVVDGIFPGFSPEIGTSGGEKRVNPSHIKFIESLMANFTAGTPSFTYSSGSSSSASAPTPPSPCLAPLPSSGPFFF